MKSIKDILKLLSAQVAIKGLPEITDDTKLDGLEINDEDWKKVEEGIKSLMTFEGAVHNTGVEDFILKQKEPGIKQNTLFRVEKRLKEIGTKADIDLEGIEKAHEMLDVFEEKINDALTKGDDEKTKKLIESYKKDKENLSREILDNEKEYEQKLGEKQSEFDRTTLKNQYLISASEYTWAEAYTKTVVKAGILNQVWNDIAGIASLKPINGVITPFDKDDPEKEYYDGNEKKSFQDLLEPRLEPYLKKSDGTPPTTPVSGNGADPDYPDMTDAEKIKVGMQQSHG